MTLPANHIGLPYRIAVLCYLYDEHGKQLLLHRIKPPNADRYSPIGGGGMWVGSCGTSIPSSCLHLSR